MTTKQLTKKIEHLERELTVLRHSIIGLQPQESYMKTAWERTRGIITPARAAKWLRYVRNQRKKSWRQYQP